MKRILSLILAVAMIFCLAACGGNKPAEETPEQAAQRSQFDNVVKELLANPTTYMFGQYIYKSEEVNKNDLEASLADFVGCEIDLIASESLFTEGDYTAYDTVFVAELESGERRIYHDVIVANATGGKPQVVVQTYFTTDEQQTFINKIGEFKSAMASFEKNSIKGFVDESKSFSSWYDKRKDSLQILKSPLSFGDEVIKALDPTEVDNRVLTWSEEFDGKSFKDTKFNLSTYNESADVRVTTDDSNLIFKDGTCTTVCRREPADSKYFYSCFKGFSTIGSMNYVGGYLELRAQLAYEAGIWPGFWLMPESDSASVQYNVEIDILEIFGEERVFSTSLHKWPKTSDRSLHEGTSIGSYMFESNEVARDWHLYGFEWTDTHYNFYVDRKCYKSVDLTDPNLLSKNFPGNEGFFQPHYVMLTGGPVTSLSNLSKNQQLKPDDTKEMKQVFDYLRLYQNPEKDKLIIFKK